MDWLERSDFYIAPASTNNHGNYEGGLLEHSLNVFDCFEKIQKCFPEIEVSDETKTIITLFHDLCKVQFYVKEKKSRKTGRTLQNGKPEWEDYIGYSIDDKLPLGHGEKSVIILMKFMNLTIDEIYSIRWHMSGFDNSVKGGDYGLNSVYKKCSIAVLVHISDLLSTYLLENKQEVNKN